MNPPGLHRTQISNFWLSCMALMLALAFVVPNHYLPWNSFHAEVLAALAVAIPCLWMSLLTKQRAKVYTSTLIVFGALGVALVQFACGLVPLFGTFWLTMAYLVGLLLALQIGEIWEKERPGQLLEFLALALIIAALLSLPIELIQWLDLPVRSDFLMLAPDIRRPIANIAQPNLLADLYLLSIVGISWLYANRRLPGIAAMVLIAVFLAGTALTGSRAAWVNVGVLLMFSTLLKPKSSPAIQGKAAVFLALFFIVCVVAAPILQAELLNIWGADTPQYSTTSANSRLTVWKMMFAASLLSPLWGYGWGQVIKVNFVFEDARGVERGLFSHSHNIFLDLVLWNGYPIGLVFIAGLLWWAWKLMRMERDLSQWHVQAMVAILAVHSLVEFPLYYTYFLLPLGLLLGSVQPYAGGRSYGSVPKLAGLVTLLAGILVLAVTVKEYLAIERSFYALRYESRGMVTSLSSSPPKVFALTHMAEHLRFARSAPDPAVTQSQFEAMEDVVRVTPGAYIMYKLAKNYGLAGNRDKAAFWLRQLCDKTHVTQCKQAREKWEWSVQQGLSPQLIPWPLP